MIIYGDKADLARELNKFPLRYSTGIYFGIFPPVNKLPEVNNGTASLIELNGKKVAITCSHVIQKYRELKAKSDDIVFQIGNLKIDPLEKIISESHEKILDIAVIDLEGENLQELRFGHDAGVDFFVPSKWPSGEIKEKEFIAFAGFPGVWREATDNVSLVFNAFTSGACMIDSVADDHFACAINRDQWIESYQRAGFDGFTLMKLGGLSGSPAFIHRGLHWEFVGIIYQHNEAFDILYVRKTKYIGQDCKILHDQIT